MIDDNFNRLSIKQHLANNVLAQRVRFFKKTTSTMDIALREAKNKAPEGTLIIADQQTGGRGRFQRPWISPPGMNLYFSIILRPQVNELYLLNMSAALAVVRTIQKITNLTAKIKWPNDIQIDGLKVSGILIDTYFDNTQQHYAILGIGINVNFDPSVHEEIKNIATSLSKETSQTIPRLEVLATFLEQFRNLYLGPKDPDSLQAAWRSSVGTLGNYIKVEWQDQIEEGLASDVDKEGNLILQRPDGSRTVLIAGEVTSQIHPRE